LSQPAIDTISSNKAIALINGAIYNDCWLTKAFNEKENLIFF
jgi:hypothetical protein